MLKLRKNGFPWSKKHGRDSIEKNGPARLPTARRNLPHGARPGVRARSLTDRFASRKEWGFLSSAHLFRLLLLPVDVLKHLLPGHHHAVNGHVPVDVQVSRLDVIRIHLSPRVVLPGVVEEIAFNEKPVP